MALPKIKLTDSDYIFIRDSGDDIGCGSINHDGHLYLIDKNKMEATRLPDKYKDTPIKIYHPCGGYEPQEGLIMVSLIGELRLQYYHTFYDTAGYWGWIDPDGNEVIPPQYVYAMSFDMGRAIVCKGDWSHDASSGCYWCKNEQWGIIDKTGQEIMPCRYDEIFFVEDSENLVLCHKGGWQEGCNCIFDLERGKEILNLDFDFDNGYMFNSVAVSGDWLIFDEHDPHDSIDYIYIYSLTEEKWLAYKAPFDERTLNGQKRIVVNKDGEEIIIF